MAPCSSSWPAACAPRASEASKQSQHLPGCRRLPCWASHRWEVSLLVRHLLLPRLLKLGKASSRRPLAWHAVHRYGTEAVQSCYCTPGQRLQAHAYVLQNCPRLMCHIFKVAAEKKITAAMAQNNPEAALHMMSVGDWFQVVKVSRRSSQFSLPLATEQHRHDKRHLPHHLPAPARPLTRHLSCRKCSSCSTCAERHRRAGHAAG